MRTPFRMALAAAVMFAPPALAQGSSTNTPPTNVAASAVALGAAARQQAAQEVGQLHPKSLTTLMPEGYVNADGSTAGPAQQAVPCRPATGSDLGAADSSASGDGADNHPSGTNSATAQNNMFRNGKQIVICDGLTLGD